MYLVQGHNAVAPVRLETAAVWSRFKHYITEPLRSLSLVSTIQKSTVCFQEKSDVNATRESYRQVHIDRDGTDTTDVNVEVHDTKPSGPDLLYSIEETPPWYLCILLGFQVLIQELNLV